MVRDSSTNEEPDGISFLYGEQGVETFPSCRCCSPVGADPHCMLLALRPVLTCLDSGPFMGLIDLLGIRGLQSSVQGGRYYVMSNGRMRALFRSWARSTCSVYVAYNFLIKEVGTA